ncbi:MAG: hypothetical protein ACI9J3_000950 [Parvicellaceae bacterium]|jgi:hypothetical protein
MKLIKVIFFGSLIILAACQNNEKLNWDAHNLIILNEKEPKKIIQKAYESLLKIHVAEDIWLEKVKITEVENNDVISSRLDYRYNIWFHYNSEVNDSIRCTYYTGNIETLALYYDNLDVFSAEKLNPY